jgi:hypothetical protein
MVLEYIEKAYSFLVNLEKKMADCCHRENLIVYKIALCYIVVGAIVLQGG